MPNLTRCLLALIAVFFLSLAIVPQAIAQPAEQSAPVTKIDKRKLLVQPRNKDGSIQQTGFFEDPVLWARDKQQAFYSQMSGALRQLRGTTALTVSWALVLLSFGYGVFHAAGPGHGKMVISAWLLATGNELKRGVLISFMSAVIQALTAITITGVLFLTVASVGATVRNVEGLLTSASFAMITVIGLYLIWTALRVIMLGRALNIATMTTAGTTRSSGLHSFDSFQPRSNAAAVHAHGPDCGCGHAHVPEAKVLRGDWSLAKAFSMAFAVGIRPCGGALLVLAFAFGNSLYGAGVIAAFAMALGTFITVTAIAALAVYSRKLATRFASRDARWLNWLGIGLRLGGGGVIVGFGAIFFLGSLGASNMFT